MSPHVIAVMALGEDTTIVPSSGHMEGLSVTPRSGWVQSWHMWKEGLSFTAQVWLGGVRAHVEGLSITAHVWLGAVM